MPWVNRGTRFAGTRAGKAAALLLAETLAHFREGAFGTLLLHDRRFSGSGTAVGALAMSNA